METKAVELTRNRFYEVFEPHCRWNTFETLDIDLKGFKQEHIKVQTNNSKGILLIYGERPLGATKWIRFRKKIKLSEDSNLNEIRAKFSDGVLSIVVPKQVKEAVDETVVEEGPRRDSVWGVKLHNWGAMKAAVLAVALGTVVAIISQIAATPVHRHPLHESPKEDVVVDTAVKQPDTAKAKFNFRLK